MFLHIIESFPLKLSEKEILGSTISIGGEEKKTKINTNFSMPSLENTDRVYIAQGTEDARKWNECLAPSSFALTHVYVFDDNTRIKFYLPKVTENSRIFRTISCIGNLLMSMKTIQRGPRLSTAHNKIFLENEMGQGGHKKLHSRVPSVVS